jgi:chemotaxis response regulator CheB
MSTDRVVLSSLDLDDLLVIVRSQDAQVGDVAITTTPDGEAAILERFVSRAGSRTVLLDDRIRGELAVLVRPARSTGSDVPPVLVVHGDVGSSASLRQLLSELPGLLQAAVVVSYAHAGWARRLTLSVLRRSSVLPVEEIQGRTELRPGVVYLAPPLGRTATLQVQSGSLVAIEEPSEPTLRVAADHLLTSVAGVVPTTTLLLEGIAPAPVDGLRAVRVGGGQVLAGAEAARAASVRQAAEAGLLAEAAGPIAVADLVELLVGDDAPEVSDELGPATTSGDRPS